MMFSLPLKTMLLATALPIGTQARAEEPTWILPEQADCQAAQETLTRTHAGSGVTSIVVTDWLERLCALALTFPAGSDLLSFIDRRLAAGMDPTMEGVKFQGTSRVVYFIFRVEEALSTIDGQPTVGEPNVQPDIETAVIFHDAFNRRYPLGAYDLQATGLTGADGGFAIDLSFRDAVGLRRFFSEAFASGISPAPVKYYIDDVLYAMPLVLRILNGGVDAYPIGTIRN